MPRCGKENCDEEWIRRAEYVKERELAEAEEMEVEEEEDGKEEEEKVVEEEEEDKMEEDEEKQPSEDEKENEEPEEEEELNRLAEERAAKWRPNFAGPKAALESAFKVYMLKVAAEKLNLRIERGGKYEFSVLY